MTDKLVKEFLRKQGAKGGKSTKKKHGKNYFSEIAKKRWAKEKKKAATDGYTEDVV